MGLLRKSRTTDSLPAAKSAELLIPLVPPKAALLSGSGDGQIEPSDPDTSELVPMAEQIERDLNAIRKAVRRPFESEVAAGDLTTPQRGVMQILVRNHGITLKELTSQIGLAHSTVSGIVDRLEKKGMLERRSDVRDGRLARLYPTVAVTRFIRDRMPALTQGPLIEALRKATEDERLEIRQALLRLRELLESRSD